MNAGPVLRRVGFTTTDLGRTETFYTALGFEPLLRGALAADEVAALGEIGRRAERLRLRLGSQEVEFTAFDPPGRAYPPTSTSTDLWFQHIAIVVADMTAAYALVRALAGHAPISRDGPQTLPSNTGGVTAYKFRDPDGHPLELLTLPPGVGDPVWQRGSGARPFLGIDHSALAVGDLARARAFYVGLGFHEAGASLNRGPEQERLDDVDGDVVDVLGLVGGEPTPHVELLGYRTGSRRPIPPGHAAADVAGTRLVLSGTGPTGLVRDPDGHLLMLQDD